MIKEKELKGTLQKKTYNYNIPRIEVEKERWETKTVEEMLEEFNN